MMFVLDGYLKINDKIDDEINDNDKNKLMVSS